MSPRIWPFLRSKSTSSTAVIPPKRFTTPEHCSTTGASSGTGSRWAASFSATLMSGLSTSPVDLANDLEQLTHDRGREAERQLVDHEELRPSHQCAAQRQHLLLAAGQVPGHLTRARLQDREQLLHLGLGRLDARLVVANDP